MKTLHLVLALMMIGIAINATAANIRDITVLADDKKDPRSGTARKLVDAARTADSSSGEARTKALAEIEALKAELCQTESEKSQLEELRKEIKKLELDDPFKENGAKVTALKGKIDAIYKDISARFWTQYYYGRLSLLEKRK